MPEPKGRKPALLLLALVAAGCGGAEADPPRVVAGPGFEVSVPADSAVQRSRRSLVARRGEDQSVGVTVFRLSREYRPALWPRVRLELDRVVTALAVKLDATLTARRTAVIAGRRARAYELTGSRDGTQRIAFVLEGRREFQLLCRWTRERASDGEQACSMLMSTFRLR